MQVLSEVLNTCLRGTYIKNFSVIKLCNKLLMINICRSIVLPKIALFSQIVAYCEKMQKEQVYPLLHSIYLQNFILLAVVISWAQTLKRYAAIPYYY